MAKDTKVRDPQIASEDANEFAGLYGHHLNEGPFIPLYNPSGNEHIRQGNNNSFLVMGRDRDGTGIDGVGGQGGTSCGMIDLIVGLGGHDYKEKIRKMKQKGEDPEASDREIDPSFIHDTARIYLTEKGHIDSYFGLAQGSEVAKASKYKSEVGIKADHTRIIGREHVKIVAGKMLLQDGGTYGERNSGGGKLEYSGKIDLIAGNHTGNEGGKMFNIFGSAAGNATRAKLQPIPKGNNLKAVLELLMDALTTLSNMAVNNTKWLQQFINMFQSHIHEANVPFGPTTPPVTTAIAIMPTWIDCWKNWMDGLILNFNIAVNRIVYLTPSFSTYINSRFVNTT
tara:strand:+ start:943 stop:1962 length:1020 start_codon:yes stop_codon:yes gene_type:complete